MQKFALALDLQDDPELIAEYERYHQRIPEAIEASIWEAGIMGLEIYRVHDRLFLLLETDDDFTFERKATLDANNPDVQAWEQLMWRFQKALPQAKNGEKWLLMQRIFEL